MRKVLIILMETLWLGVFLLVPLYFVYFPELFGLKLNFLQTEQVFEINKIVLFRLLVEILIFFWLIQKLLLIPKTKKTLPWVFKVSLVCLVIGLLGTLIWSRIGWVNWWGNYNRHQGVFSYLHYLFFCWIIFDQLGTGERLQRILRIISLAGFLTAFYAILQYFSLDPVSVYLKTDVFLGRPFSSLGHPNYLGYFLILTLPFSVFITVQAKRNFTKALGIFNILVQLVALGFTFSRGAWLGILAAGWFYSLIYGLAHKKKAIHFCWVVPLIVIALLIAVNVWPSSKGRLTLAGENSRSLQSRLLVWQASWHAFQKNPLGGTGLDTFYLIFPRYQNQKLLTLEQPNEIADRTHNGVLETLVNTGLIGLITYLIFLVSLYLVCLKTVFQNKSNAKLILLGLSVLFGLGVANQFGFSTTVHQVYFWGIVAILLWLISDRKQIQYKGGLLQIGRTLIGLLLISAVLLAIKLNLNAGRANHYFYLAQNELGTKKLALLQRTIQLDPWTPNYQYNLLNFQLNNTLSLNPETIKTVGRLTNFQDYEYWLIKGEWEMRNDQPEEAEKSFQEAAVLGPYQIRVFETWGRALYESGDYKKATRPFEAILDFMPNFWQYDGTIAKQSPLTQDAYRRFFKDNPNFRRIFWYLGESYAKLGRTQKAEEYEKHWNTETLEQ